MMFYLKAKRLTLKGLLHKESKINLPAEDKVKYEKNDKENWRKKMCLPQKLDINVTHRYSHFGGKFLHLNYDALGVQLNGTIEVCDSCA